MSQSKYGTEIVITHSNMGYHCDCHWSGSTYWYWSVILLQVSNQDHQQFKTFLRLVIKRKKHMIRPRDFIEKKYLFKPIYDHCAVDRSGISNIAVPISLISQQTPLGIGIHIDASSFNEPWSEHGLTTTIVCQDLNKHTITNIRNIVPNHNYIFMNTDGNTVATYDPLTNKTTDVPAPANINLLLQAMTTHIQSPISFPKEVLIILDRQLHQYTMKPKQPGFHVPLPLSTNAKGEYFIHDDPIIYTTWFIWCCLQIISYDKIVKNVLQNDLINFIKAYMHFLRKANQIMINTGLVTSIHGISAPFACQVESGPIQFNPQTQQATFISMDPSSRQLTLDVKPYPYKTCTQLNHMMPDPTFHQLFSSTLKVIQNWLKIQKDTERYVKTSLKGKAFEVSVFDIYEYFVKEFEKTAPNVTFIILDAIYKQIVTNYTSLSIESIHSGCFHSSFSGQSQFLDFVEQSFLTDRDTLFLKAQEKAYLPNKIAKSNSRHQSNEFTDVWVIANMDKGHWQLDPTKMSDRLAKWLQCYIQDKAWHNDECRILLDLITELSSIASIQLWLDDRQVNDIYTSIPPQRNGRDMPLIVNLSPTSRHLRLHYYTSANKHQHTDMDLLWFHKEYSTHQISIQDFLLIVEVLHRRGGDKSDRTSFAIMNATFTPIHADQSIRTHMGNPFADPNELSTYVKNIHLPGYITSTFTSTSCKGLEHFSSIAAFLKQTNSSDNTWNQAIDIGALPSNKNSFKSEIQCQIQSSMPWAAIIQQIKTKTSTLYPKINKYQAQTLPDQLEMLKTSVTLRYMVQRGDYPKKSKQQPKLLFSYQELDITTTSRSSNFGPNVNTLFFTFNPGNTTNLYLLYFYTWLGVTPQIAQDNNFITFISLLNDTYKTSTVAEWSKKLEIYMVTTNSMAPYFKRLLILYMTFYQGLLCPFMFTSYKQLQDKKYSFEKRVLRNYCIAKGLSNTFLLTLSYTIPGQLALVCFGSKTTETYVTTFQAEDIIQDHGHPATRLWSRLFIQTHGMTPIVRNTFGQTLVDNKAIAVDHFWHLTTLPATKDIMFPKNDIAMTQLLIEKGTEIDYMIASFFINGKTDGVALYKQVDQFNDHGIRNFIDLALCTSGKFINKIRDRYQKRFPHRPRNEHSNYNQLCNELLARQNISNQITIKASQINPPPQFITSQNRFNVQDEKAKEWLLKHHGFDIQEVEGLSTHQFNPTHMQTESVSLIAMQLNSQLTIDNWFYKNVFRPMNDTLITDSYIRFMNEAYALLYCANREYQPTLNDKPADTLLQTLFQSTRHEWEIFIEGMASNKMMKTKVSKLLVQDIYNEIHGTSPNDTISNLIRREQSKIDYLASPSERIKAWIREETTVTNNGYERIAILVIYNLFRILIKYNLIQ